MSPTTFWKVAKIQRKSSEFWGLAGGGIRREVGYRLCVIAQQVVGLLAQSLRVLDAPPRTEHTLIFPVSVFQLTHNVYKPFIFAADTLTDLSM